MRNRPPIESVKLNLYEVTVWGIVSNSYLPFIASSQASPFFTAGGYIFIASLALILVGLIIRKFWHYLPPDFVVFAGTSMFLGSTFYGLTQFNNSFLGSYIIEITLLMIGSIAFVLSIFLIAHDSVERLRRKAARIQQGSGK